jgi:hypothetical protein
MRKVNLVHTVLVRTVLALAGLGLVFSASLLPAHAAGDKPAKAKAAVAKKAPSTGRDVVLTLSNKRKSSVVFFTVYGKETNGQEPNLLKEALESGKSIKVKAKSVAGCSLSVAADFEDGSSVEATGLDICKDPVVKLVD